MSTQARAYAVSLSFAGRWVGYLQVNGYITRMAERAARYRLCRAASLAALIVADGDGYDARPTCLGVLVEAASAPVRACAMPPTVDAMFSEDGC